jgi:hypothetical protein
MFMPGTGDLVWMADPGEIAFAKTIGYVDVRAASGPLPG